MGRKKFKDFINESTLDNTPDYIAGIKSNAGILSTVKTTTPGGGGVSLFAGAAAGTDTYTASIPGITSYSANLSLRLNFANGNTGASTLNVNGLGDIPIVKFGNAALDSGDIKAGQILDLIYDGANFQVPSVTSNIVDAQ